MRYAGRDVLLLHLLLLPLAAWAQVPAADTETGLPFFHEYFSPQDYGYQPQNWSVVQDSRGVVYVANNDGVLEYDGVSWRLIPPSAGSQARSMVVRSLAVDAQDVVYVGIQGDFGYLKPDSTGTLHYESLLHYVAPEDQDFADVWGTHATAEGVYFQAQSRLFRWDGDTVKVWRSDEGFHTSFVVGGQFYVREGGVGLQAMLGETLHLVSDGARFADLKIYVMLPHSGSRILIGTREQGLFLYDGETAVPFKTEVDAFLQAALLYHGCTIPGGYFALSTLGQGVAIIDEQGRLVQVLDQNGAIEDGVVNYVYYDRQDGLWLALNNKGIMRVDMLSPLSRFDRRVGLDGVVNAIQRHRGRLYVATGSGLYYLDDKPLQAGRERELPSFVRVLDDQAFALLSADSVLFAATDRGVYIIGRQHTHHIQTKAFQVVASRRRPGLIYVGLKDRLGTLRHDGTQWILDDAKGKDGSPLGEEIHWITEEQDGTLWLSNLRGSVWRLGFAAGTDVSLTKERFDASSGLPEGQVVISTFNGRAVLITKEGIYRYDDAKPRSERRFYPDATLMPYVTQGEVRSFTVEEDKSIWIMYSDRVEIVRLQPDGTYVREAPEIFRLLAWDISPQLYVEQDGVVWLSREDQLIRYDPSVFPDKVYQGAFSALVRRVTTVGGGRVIHGGRYHLAEAGASRVELSYEQNDLRIEYAAPSFNQVSPVEYHYFLEGHDHDWSDWSTETHKTFTHLEEGKYTFRVRARNAQGVLSTEAAFPFRILPPWFRTWWAYLLYVFGLGILGIFARQYRQILQENRQVQEQAEELARERLVNERLQEVNKRLQLANESLTQANQLKDEFLANTSHELRTPLTAILGFTSVLKEEASGSHQEFLGLIEENGQRLLQTLNALLDFAKLRAGMMEMETVPVEVALQAGEVVRLLQPLAQKKGLRLRLESRARGAVALLDRHSFERVLYNLIGNAIKFTNVGGVTVTVDREGGRVAVGVRDTGIGIEAAFVPQLFEAFKQESSGLTRSHEGSGLGLAITAQLVGLMGGELGVESAKGSGSVFTVWFPLCEEVPENEEHAAEPVLSANRV
jgi:signal transduction histidine kinase